MAFELEYAAFPAEVLAMAVAIVPVGADDAFLAGVVAAVPVEEALADFLVRAYEVIQEVALAEVLAEVLAEGFVVAYFDGMAYSVEGVGYLLKQVVVLTLAVQR